MSFENPNYMGVDLPTANMMRDFIAQLKAHLERIPGGTGGFTSPRAPTGLTVVGIPGGLSVVFNKNTERDLSAYEVYVSLNSEFIPVIPPNNPAAWNGTTNTLRARGNHIALEILGLAAGTTYYVKVVAVNFVGARSIASAQASGVPLQPPADLTVPTSLANIGLSAGSDALYRDAQGNWAVRITLSLTNIPSDAGRLYIQAKFRKNGSTDYLLADRKVIADGSESFTIDGLLPGVAYDFAVVPVSYFGVAGTGKTQSNYTISSTPAAPSAPTGLTVQTGPGWTIQLIWDVHPDPDVLEFEVWRKAGNYPADPSDAAQIADEAGCNHIDTTGTAGSQYTWYLKAVNRLSQTSGFSTGAVATVPQTSPDLTEPASLAEITLSAGSDTLYQDGQGNWAVRITLSLGDIPVDANRAYIQIKAKQNGSTQYWLEDQLATASGDMTCTVDGLSPGVAYDFLAMPVSHFGIAGTGKALNNYTVSSTPAAPAVPTGVTVQAGPGKTVRISWTAPANPDVLEYEIWRRNGNYPADPNGAAKIADEAGCVHIDTTGTAGSVYTWYVKSVSQINQTSGFSTGASTTVPQTSPDTTAPASLAGISLSAGSDALYRDAQGNWAVRTTLSLTSIPADSLRAYIQAKYRKNGSTEYLLADQKVIANGSGSFTIDGLLPGTAYDFAVVPVSNFGIIGTGKTQSNYTTSSTPAAPSAPTGLAAQAGPGKTVRLTWDVHADPDVLEYEVYRKVGNYPTTPSGATKIADEAGCSHVDTTGTAGSQYTWYLKAISRLNQTSAFCTGVVATVPQTAPDPTAPASLAGCTLSAGSEFYYQDAQGILRARITLSLGSIPTDSLRAYIQIKSKQHESTQYWLEDQVVIASGATTATVDELSPGVAYDFLAVPMSNFGVAGTAKALSNYVVVADTTPPDDPESAPAVLAGIKALTVSFAASTDLNLLCYGIQRRGAQATWDVLNQQYKVPASPNWGGWETVEPMALTTSWTDLNVSITMCYQYRYRITDRARNSSNYSAESNAVVPRALETSDLHDKLIARIARVPVRQTVLSAAATPLSAGSGLKVNLDCLIYGADQCTGGAALSDGDLDAIYAAALAVDNNANTHWLSKAYEVGQSLGNAYIGYDFGAGVTKHIRQIHITPYTSSASDLCTGGTAISGGDSTPKAQAYDNNTSTPWSSSQTGVAVLGNAYIGYDFGASIKRYVRKIRYYLYTSGYYTSPQYAKVQWSDNMSDWTDAGRYYLFDTSAPWPYSVWIELILPALAPHRAWRLLADSTVYTDCRWAAYEIEFLEDLITTPPSVKIQRKLAGDSWIDVSTESLTGAEQTINLSQSVPSRYWRVLANADLGNNLWGVNEIEMKEATGSPLIATCACGFDDGGAVDRLIYIPASIANYWSGLAASSTNYLYLDIDCETHEVTPGSTTLKPLYQYNLPDSPSNGQHCLRYFDWRMWRYDSGAAAWAEKWRVFVGKAVTNGSAVTSVECFPLCGGTIEQVTQEGWAETIVYNAQTLGDIPGWVEPGDTVLLEALTERFTTNTTGVVLKAFRILRPGYYRITFEIKPGSSAYIASAWAEDEQGNALTIAATHTGNTTYTAKTLDTNMPIGARGLINIRVKTSDSSYKAYIRNCRLKYTDAVTTPASVVTD